MATIKGSEGAGPKTVAKPPFKAKRQSALAQQLCELCSIVEVALPLEPREARVRLRTLIFKLGGQGAQPANATDVAWEGDEDVEDAP